MSVSMFYLFLLSVFCLSVMQNCRAYGNHVCGTVWPVVRHNPSLLAVLGSISDTCTYLDTKVSSIMIHFWYSISISINDTFQVYQYHKSLINDCDTITGIQNSLLTRFAISVMNSWSRVSTTVSRILSPRHARYRQIVKLKTIWLWHSAINWLSNQCCRHGMYKLYLSDTDTELKMLSRHSRVSNLESFHQIQHNSTIVGTIAAKTRKPSWRCQARAT